ncbi:hypothetical protein H8K35_08150 [Undibacterium sp. LX40W]|uniref:Uncharacterized protein n=1 Tax=Undibacterium nitidum TaxID=2762298 RepID=A0A923KL93_9BURK|nr:MULTISPECIES: hypothetical protein [Undibacterium]MBC3881595.1 hypothetical protein [Undibacterium nitidum]MBC3891623.1 hypothetical protein [Undibacterium sp. LX40W]
MKFSIIVLFLIAASHVGISAQAQQDWAVEVKQNARNYRKLDNVQLKRAPFDINFTGPKTMGYAIVAATSCEGLEQLKSPSQISTLIRSTNIAAESASPSENTYIGINTPGTLTPDMSSAHTWSERKDDDIHSFQSFVVDAEDRLTATRKIETILLYLPGDKTKEVPVEQYPYREACIFMTGLPPVGYMAHVQPKLIRIVFH